MCLILYGASGHGKVILDIANQCGMKVLGFIDDNADLSRQTIKKIKILGTYKETKKHLDPVSTEFIISIGNNITRLAKAELVIKNKFKLAILIHPKTIIADDVTIGAGTVVMAGVVINSETKTGENAIINTGAIIDHECVISDGVHISPAANLAGNVKVGKCSHIGIGATIIQNITIGDNVIVGAGSVVLSDVPDNTVVAGAPARMIQNTDVKNASNINR